MSRQLPDLAWTSKSDAEAPLLGISIVNYFSSESVSRLLDSLRLFAGANKVRVVVVDNSNDYNKREPELLKKSAKAATTATFQVEVLPAASNLGYGAGNNMGMRCLIDRGVKLLWVLNPDTVVSGSASLFLEEIASSTASLWSTCTVEDGKTSHGFGFINTLTGKSTKRDCEVAAVGKFNMSYPSGHSIVFTREAWESLGGFDEDYFLFMEEADLTLRSLHQGLKIGSLQCVSVHHNQGLTTGSTTNLETKSLIAFTEATKSRVIFFRKFFPLRIPLLLLSRYVYALKVYCKGNPAGAKGIVSGITSGLFRQLKDKDRSVGK